MIGLLGLIFMIWCLIKCLKNKELRDVEKLIWVLVIILIPLFGALIYFLVEKDL